MCSVHSPVYYIARLDQKVYVARPLSILVNDPAHFEDGQRVGEITVQVSQSHYASFEGGSGVLSGRRHVGGSTRAGEEQIHACAERSSQTESRRNTDHHRRVYNREPVRRRKQQDTESRQVTVEVRR